MTEQTCSWCGKPLEEGQELVSFDGGTYHVPCAIDSESGKPPPVSDHRSHGLWQINLPAKTPATFDPVENAKAVKAGGASWECGECPLCEGTGKDGRTPRDCHACKGTGKYPWPPKYPSDQ